jgi:hypothetical protein
MQWTPTTLWVRFDVIAYAIAAIAILLAGGIWRLFGS